MWDYFLITVTLMYYTHQSCRDLMHYKKNETIYNINDNLTSLVYVNRRPLIVIPRELQPFEFELFFN